METDLLNQFKRRTTLRQVEILVLVRRTGSLTAAAKELGMSVANVSRACRRFEENIGLNIFRKTRKGVILSPLGEFLIGELDEVGVSINLFSIRFEASNALSFVDNAHDPHSG